MASKPTKAKRGYTVHVTHILPPLDARAVEREFDALLTRAHRAGVLDLIQVNRLADAMQREIGPRIERELRLAAAEAERAEQARLDRMSPAKRAQAQLLETSRQQAEETV